MTNPARETTGAVVALKRFYKSGSIGVIERKEADGAWILLPGYDDPAFYFDDEYVAEP